MAFGAKSITPHADVAAAVTGHLGPGAARATGRLVYPAFAARTESRRRPHVAVKKLELAREPGDSLQSPELRRIRRQRSATAHLLSWIAQGLREIG